MKFSEKAKIARTVLICGGPVWSVGDEEVENAPYIGFNNCVGRTDHRQQAYSSLIAIERLAGMGAKL